jgi:hypothetical protein
LNTAGNREDTVNFMINGINLNDPSQNQITFQPSINTVLNSRPATWVQRGVRPYIGDDCQHCHAFRLQRIPRRSFQLLSQQRAGCAELLQRGEEQYR